MPKKSLIIVVVYTVVTLGVYQSMWLWKNRDPLNELGANVPNPWLMFVPGYNFYWLWRYCRGVELVTRRKISAVGSYFLLTLAAVVGIAWIQHLFNEETAPA